MKCIIFLIFVFLITATPAFCTKEKIKILDINSCFKLALKHNSNLLLKKYNISSSDYSLKIAKTIFDPGFSIRNKLSHSKNVDFDSRDKSLSNTILYETSVDKKLGANGTIALTTQFQDTGSESIPGTINPDNKYAYMGISFTQPLGRDSGSFQAYLDINKAKIDVNIEKLNFDLEIQSLYFNIIRGYFDVLKSKKTVGIYNSHLESAKQMYDMAKAKFKMGLGTKLDVSQNEVKVAEASSNLLSKENDYKNSLDTLFNLIGVTEDLDIELKDEVNENINLGKMNNLEKIARKNRIELKINRLKLKKADFDIESARRNLKMEINLKTSYGRSGTAENFSDSLDLDNMEWYVSVDSDLNIEKRRYVNRYKKSLITRKQLEESRKSLIRTIKFQLNTVKRNLKVSLQRVEVLQKSLKQAENNLEYAQLSYKKGLSNLINVLDAQNDLRRNRLDYISALINFEIYLKEKDKLIGKLPVLLKKR